MKNISLSIILICCSLIVLADNKNQGNHKNIPPVVQPSVINSLDTVVLDLSQQILAGDSITFPVSFISDDTIFALDFSFKYDQNNFIYDTITNIAANLQSVSFYNPNDSTVRYTSFSLQSIASGTAIVSVHFTTLAGIICIPDLNNVQGFLNGDLCSIKIVPCIAGSPSGIDDLNNKTLVNVYPNPAQQILNIESAENSTLELCDLNGRRITAQTEVQTGEKRTLNIADISNGIYLLKISNQNSVSVKKVVIEK